MEESIMFDIVVFAMLITFIVLAIGWAMYGFNKIITKFKERS